jgi:hypothetical protein
MALVMALFVTLIVSALAASMTFMARSETLSSHSYTTMARARYAAESGLAAATHYLLSSAYAAVAPGTASDPLSNYNTTVSPVTRTAGSGTVILSTVSGASNYPLASVVSSFATAAGGTLNVGAGTMQYEARATLLAMRQITDTVAGTVILLQTWEVTGVGRRGGAGSGQVEVSAVIERETRPTVGYAVFAGYNGCNALNFSGNASTGSYDSSIPVAAGATPVVSLSGGHVGTNGNLGETGNAEIHGTLSTPRAGVGACTANNVTAQTVSGNATVDGGLVQLPQPVTQPTPPWPNPPALSSNQSISGSGSCPSGYASICAVGGGTVNFTPVAGTPVLMGNVALSGNAIVKLRGGTYIMNSLNISGNSQIIVEPGTGPVKILLDGRQSGAGSTVLSISGNGIANKTWDPTFLSIEYAGTKGIAMSGNGDTATLLYAPNADANFSGNAQMYGSIVVRTLTASGNMQVIYDVRLKGSSVTVGNPVMSSFTWRTF